LPRHLVRVFFFVCPFSMLMICGSVLLGSLQHGSCTIQPTKIAFSADELVDMVERCGLNRLNQFSTFLSTHLTTSRRDARILALLSNLDEVIHSGLPLPREDEDWAYRNKINLKVRAHPRFPRLFLHRCSELVWKYGMWCHACVYWRQRLRCTTTSPAARSVV
jgi:hypothetical protein